MRLGASGMSCFSPRRTMTPLRASISIFLSGKAISKQRVDGIWRMGAVDCHHLIGDVGVKVRAFSTTHGGALFHHRALRPESSALPIEREPV